MYMGTDKRSHSIPRLLVEAVLIACVLLTCSLLYLAHQSKQNPMASSVSSSLKSGGGNYLDITEPVAGVVDSSQPSKAENAPAPAFTTSSDGDCYPLSNAGNCYEAGQYCRVSDEDETGISGSGESIVCEENNGLRWVEY